jgi:hypothetical protein
MYLYSDGMRDLVDFCFMFFFCPSTWKLSAFYRFWKSQKLSKSCLKPHILGVKIVSKLRSAYEPATRSLATRHLAFVFSPLFTPAALRKAQKKLKREN